MVASVAVIFNIGRKVKNQTLGSMKPLTLASSSLPRHLPKP